MTKAEFNKVSKEAKTALSLASRHDPDHERRLDVIERQLQRLGAPQYRLVRKGKAGK